MGFGFSRFCRAKSNLKREPMSFMNHHTASHEGIKTVGVDNLCDFSSNSDLCVCIVTWNMNGQVRSNSCMRNVTNLSKLSNIN